MSVDDQSGGSADRIYFGALAACHCDSGRQLRRQDDKVRASCCDSGRRGLATTKTTKPEPPAVIVGGEGFNDKRDD